MASESAPFVLLSGVGGAKDGSLYSVTSASGVKHVTVTEDSTVTVHTLTREDGEGINRFNVSYMLDGFPRQSLLNSNESRSDV